MGIDAFSVFTGCHGYRVSELFSSAGVDGCDMGDFDVRGEKKLPSQRLGFKSGTQSAPETAAFSLVGGPRPRGDGLAVSAMVALIWFDSQNPHITD